MQVSCVHLGLPLDSELKSSAKSTVLFALLCFSSSGGLGLPWGTLSGVLRKVIQNLEVSKMMTS